MPMQVLALQKGDNIAAVLPVSDFTQHEYMLLLTRKAKIKKLALAQFQAVRSSGMKVMGLEVGSDLDTLLA